MRVLLSDFRLRLDPLLVGLLLLLMLLGLIVLYSATDQNTGLVLRQCVRLGFGLALMVIACQIPPAWYRRWAPWLYALGLLLLIVVLFLGVGRGARRWLDLGLFWFQPSEAMKLAMPLMLAAYLHSKRLPPSLTCMTACAVLIAMPVALIVQQPDLGTSILVAAGGAVVLFLSGLRWRWMLLSLAVLAVSAPFLWTRLHDY
ncbi:MAG: FtsW/RodA/SpoVE family cell cycle protein, partial [Pseudomonadota bacterium]